MYSWQWRVRNFRKLTGEKNLLSIIEKCQNLGKFPGKRVEKLTNHCLAIIKTSKSWGAFDKREGGGQEYIFRPALTTGRQLNKQVEWVGGG